MRKLVLVILMGFILMPVMQIHAQESDYASAYKNYVNTYDFYQRTLSEYRLAKAQYQQAGTLVSQSKAREATVAMLQARDNVVINYLTAIKMKLLEAEGVSDTFKSGLENRIDAEIIWFQDHLSRLDSAGTLEDLEDDSDEASDRFIQTQRIIYDSLGTVAGGKVTVLRDELNTILSDARTKNFEIKSNGDLNVDSVDRWISEVDNKLTRSLDKSIESESLIQTLYTKQRANDFVNIYSQVIASLQESVQLLRDGSRFTKEIVKVFTGEN